MGEQQHPKWCDRNTCSVERESSPFYTHCSHQFRGTFDPDSGICVNLEIWQIRNRYTYLMFEFGNDCCEGHEITPRQARELHHALGNYLAEFESVEFEPTRVSG